MTQMVYELNNDIRRLSYMERGDAYDLKSFSFSKSAELLRTYEPRLLDLPKVSFFYVYSKKNFVEELDSLHTHGVQCVFSQKTIDVLLSVKDFQYRKYPTAILAENLPDSKTPYDNPDFYKTKSLREDLFIFQTFEFLDVFDWEKSKYRQTDLNKEVGSPGRVSEYVFQEPPGGFPPLFRLPYQPAHLFISHDARQALKLNNTKGFSFSKLNDLWNSEVDIPISNKL
jgi:hypothetical protein